ncbi:MAG: FAD-binding oxidoreductase [Clostridiales Family XIII bacterium]|jgi:D-lactate dehydrogenase (cytochrome)|nr:FAD-binding oxidoreductase [Clostridiales Family XIII bacterium]
MPNIQKSEYFEYLKDESCLTGECDGLIFISNRDEIAAAVKSSRPLTVRGAGTGITGAAVPSGGTVLNLSRFSGVNGMGEDETGVFLDVYPGTSLSDLRAAVSRKDFNYFFAPDPTETTATIGGMFGTNAGGPTSLLYGRTADHVIAADIRLASGELLSVERGRHTFDELGCCSVPDGRKLKVKYSDAPPAVLPLLPRKGTDLLDLFAGSEGMLGIFENIRLKLTPVPKHRWSIVFFMDSDESARLFISDALKASKKWNGVSLSALDYLDRASLELFRQFRLKQTRLRTIPEPPGNARAIFAELVSDDASETETALNGLLQICSDAGGDEDLTWAADTEKEIEKLRLFRHGIPDSVNGAVGQNRRADDSITKMALDITVPGKAIDVLLRDTHMILDKCGVPYALTAHAGANHFHINLLPENRRQIELCRSVTDEFFNSAVKSGGMIAAENGIGKVNRDIFRNYIPPEHLELMRRVKQFFDTDGVLNPGNMV